MTERPLVVLCQLEGREFPEVEAELREQWPAFARYLGRVLDQDSYARSVCQWWDAGRELVIVEGDSLPPPGSVAALLHCPAEWCAHPSWVGRAYLPDTLGLARFSGRLTRRLPELAWQALHRRRPAERWTPARQVDSNLARLLYHHGLSPHLHFPPARHLRYANEPVDATTRPAST